MSGKQYAVTEARLKRAHDKWLEIMGMKNWRTILIFHRDDYPIPPHPDGTTLSAMYVVADWRYMIATIHVNVRALRGFPEEKLEQYLVHEFAHCLINELRRDDPESQAHEERVVTMLTLALVRAHDTGWNDGRADLRERQETDSSKGDEA